MLNIKNNILLLKKKPINIKNKVKTIIKDIKIYGEFALLYYIKFIDGIDIKSIKELIINRKTMKSSYNKISNKKKKILKEIYLRLKRYHFHNYVNSWQINNNIDIIYGQKINNIEKICIYVPGGNTIYPSSIYMNCIPSLIYRPNFICMVSPIKNGVISNTILSISYLNKINKIIFSGGVHTLSCVVFGTRNIIKVDKLTGPGNYYITKAKKIFFGSVGIDMLAGPSELIILCDGFIHPNVISYDFFSQLEHDINASCCLFTNNKKYLNLLYTKIYKLLLFQKNKKIIFKSLKNSILLFNKINNLLEIINFLAPEHLMICIKNSNKVVKKIKNCGAIFISYKTTETYGDYVIGPSHVIPTNSTSKYFSSLNIYDFCKKIGIIKIYNNKYCKILSSFFSKIEKFFSHSFSSIIRK
ncbi:histidinol dehydrogenase [Candidatus Carsonella ruddii]|uniref:Histidinol dehydrogenase n=1 Tax=Candidatus Carsonella ruddii (Diaphorina cf. continua) TaxID=2661587 RepID=A0A7R6W005_CARRU|nr:histidinol dehydrogenase [Candidatus Carsonella ruddii (Diaphorina cf. continua)]BCG49272.1 histidinol dehydrogenase [Candidatus Carsonella ruddii (Diaphorina cf. continua)]